MAAVLSTELGNTDKIYSLTQECKRMDITVLNPDILSSSKRFIVNNDMKIEYGLGAIKGVADSFIKHICAKRESDSFKDLWDFSKKVDIKLGGKKSLEALSQSGAFDSIAPSRSTAIRSVSDMLKDGSKNSSGNAIKSGDLFANTNHEFDPYEKYSKIQEFSLSELLSLEKKSLGYYLSGHPVDAINKQISVLRSSQIGKLNIDSKKGSLVALINSSRQIRDRSGKPLTFINFDDGTGTMDGVISSDVLENCHNILKEGEILVIKGSIELDDYRSKELGTSSFRMRVKEVNDINGELKKKLKIVTIDLPKSKIDSLEDVSKVIYDIDTDFWEESSGCKINIKVISDNSEAIIELGDSFNFLADLQKVSKLIDIFGSDAISLSK